MSTVIPQQKRFDASINMCPLLGNVHESRKSLKAEAQILLKWK